MLTGAVSATRDAGRALPSRRQKTSREELHTNRVIMSNLAESVAIGAIPSADGAIPSLAGIVIVGVASSADLAGDATIGVASLADVDSRCYNRYGVPAGTPWPLLR